MVLALSACGSVEEESVVVVDGSESDSSAYTLIPVTREDVVLTHRLEASYMQGNEQTVSFSTGGRRIFKVYVDRGDKVKRGDLLMELDVGDTQDRIDDLEYAIADNELKLKYLDEEEKMDKDAAYNSFVYNDPDIDEDDLAVYDKYVDSINQNYRYSREDLEDELEFDRKKLSELNALMSSAKVYSVMNGTVYSIADDLEGSVSKKDDAVMVIVDNASGMFETNDPEYASFFHEGEAVHLEGQYKQAVRNYEVVPYAIGSWGDKQIFEVISGDEEEGVEVGTTGTIIVETNRRDDVLSLPLDAVYYADGKPYVYMLDENEFKQMIWIETGLEGDDRIEIVSGLNEGDKVVYR